MPVEATDLTLWRDALRQGLTPFIERTLERHLGADWRKRERDLRLGPLDTQALLGLLLRNWGPIFSQHLSRPERPRAELLRDFRNRIAHEEDITDDDMVRALDNGTLLLNAVGAPKEAEQLRVRHEALLAARYRKVPPARLDASPSPAVSHEHIESTKVEQRNPPSSGAERAMNVTPEQYAAYRAKPENMAWKRWMDQRICVGGQMDLERLYVLAREYGVTKRYDGLNAGQQRMNIGNQLRKRVPRELWVNS